MFRKSGNRKFRKKNLNVEEDEEDRNENQSTDSNVINTIAKVEKVKSASKIEKTFSSNTLLSFDHDDIEETEVFQVKKSKESRRLSKKASKEKSKKVKPKPQIKEEEEDGNDGKTPETFPSRNGSDPGKLEALRAELREMSKLDEDEDEEDEDEIDGDTNGADKPILFARRNEFNIPDAATIHALKKKREMARQLGTGQDYIPIDDSQKYEGKFDSMSRLVREDENDASDDEGPISFSAVKNEQPMFTKVDSEDEEEVEEDEETKRWEDEQIRKGVSTSQLQQEKEQQAFGVVDNYQGYNIYPYGGGYNLDTTQSEKSKPLKGQLKTLTTEETTLESIVTRLKNRLDLLQDTHRGRMLEKNKIVSHSQVSEESIEKLVVHGREAERQYSFYQEMRGYVRDLIECLNEKVGDISKGGCGTGMSLAMCLTLFDTIIRESSTAFSIYISSCFVLFSVTIIFTAF